MLDTEYLMSNKANMEHSFFYKLCLFLPAYKEDVSRHN